MTRFVLELFRRSVVAEKGGGRRGGGGKEHGGGREWRERNGIFAGHDHIGGEKGRMNRREKSSRKKKERKEGRKGKGKGKGNKKKKEGKKKRERGKCGEEGICRKQWGETDRMVDREPSELYPIYSRHQEGRARAAEEGRGEGGEIC